MTALTRTIVRLCRNGNALCVNIPVEILARVGWKRGDFLAVGTNDGLALHVYRVNLEALAKTVPRGRSDG